MLNRNAVFLDAGTMGEDISLKPLLDLLPNIEIFQKTTPEQITERIENAEIVILNKVKLRQEQLSGARKLKLICLTATGSDNVALKAARQQGVSVCNVSGYSVDSVPQHALCLMLMLATRAHEYDHDVRTGEWSKSDHFTLLHHPIISLKGKTLGIAGYGALGQQLVKLAAPFEMKIQLCNLPGQVKNPNRMDLSDMLPVVDFLSLHCPLTPQTDKMLGTAQFKAMKNTAFLINTARGQLVDEKALAQALKSAQIAGAGIDVLSQEPPSQNHFLLDPKIPNLILTPHNAWGSIESRQRLLTALIRNINQFFLGFAENVIN